LDQRSQSHHEQQLGGIRTSVITDWNATAVATIVTDAGKANAEAFLWYAFEQAAVYKAVVGITRCYELYRWDSAVQEERPQRRLLRQPLTACC
jgi:hypothetical protein